jgi:hypothetical protein
MRRWRVQFSHHSSTSCTTGGNNWKNFLPSVFDWKKMVENESCLNTPPVYAIYMAGLCFDWLVPLAQPPRPLRTSFRGLIPSCS